MVEQGYIYLDDTIQSMTEFFETRIENLERFDSLKDSNKVQKHKSYKKKYILIKTFLKKGVLKVQGKKRNSVDTMVHVGTGRKNVLPL